MGGDREIVGRSILLNGEPYTVIGVLPGASEFDRRLNDIWIPLAFPPNAPRNYHSFGAVARMKPGVTLEQAQAEMSAIAAGIAEKYPDVKKGWGAVVDRYVDMMIGDQMRLSLKVLMWAVGGRPADRLRQPGEPADGAGYAAVARDCGAAGDGRGTRPARPDAVDGEPGALDARRGHRPGARLRAASVDPRPDAPVLPAARGECQYGRTRVAVPDRPPRCSLRSRWGWRRRSRLRAIQSSESLKEGGRSNTAGRTKVVARNFFVGAQVAVAFILLVGGGLLVRSLQKVLSIDTGFRTEGLIAAYPSAADGAQSGGGGD